MYNISYITYRVKSYISIFRIKFHKLNIKYISMKFSPFNAVYSYFEVFLKMIHNHDKPNYKLIWRAKIMVNNIWLLHK